MKDTFKVVTFIGTLLIVLAFIGWISLVTTSFQMIAKQDILSIALFAISCTFTLVFTLGSIDYGIHIAQNEETTIMPCVKCGKQVLYYWFLWVYIGQHFCSTQDERNTVKSGNETDF